MQNRVLIRILCSLTFGLALSAGAMAASVTGRQGLWHALEKKSGSTLFYMVYSDKEIRAYSADWERINTKFEVSDNVIRFRIPIGVEFHRVEARFDEGGLSGTYVRPHVQDTWTMEWTGRHVNSQGDWDPWQFTNAATGGIINLLADVISGGPFESEDQFTSFWKEKIDPLYYPLLVTTVYNDPFNLDFRKARQQKLSEYYRDLKANWKKLAAFAKSYPTVEAQVVKDLTKLYPWFNNPGYLVMGLSPGNTEYSYSALPLKGVNPRRFMLLDTNWVSTRLNDTQARYLTAQALLTLEHMVTNRPDTSIRAEFLQRGLTAFLAARLPYSQDPKDFLYQEDQEPTAREKAFRAFALEFSKKFKQQAFRVRQDFFLSDLRSSSYLFAYSFVQMLSKRFNPEEMLRGFQYERLRDEMAAFARSTKEVPQLAQAGSGTPSTDKN